MNISEVGKSGHVGRKIAATCASLGITSFFVNPTVSTHSVLGMITRNDVSVLISSSGEITKHTGLVAYTVEA